MHRESQVASRYSNALFELSMEPQESGIFAKPQQLLSELEVFNKALEEMPELRSFFENPTISREVKLEALQSLESKLSSIYRFLELLIEADRMGCMGEIVAAFRKSLEKSQGELRVQLETSAEFGEAMLNEIRSLLESQWKKKVTFEVKVNPDLIGGFVASASGKSFDASVRTQLQMMKKKLER